MLRKLSTTLMSRSIWIYALVFLVYRFSVNQDLVTKQRAKYLLGIFYNEGLENYPDGIVYFQYMIRQEPDQPKNYFFLGYCYFQLGQWNQAVVWLEKAYVMNPDESRYQEYLKQTYVRLGRDQEESEIMLRKLRNSSGTR